MSATYVPSRTDDLLWLNRALRSNWGQMPRVVAARGLPYPNPKVDSVAFGNTQATHRVSFYLPHYTFGMRLPFANWFSSSGSTPGPKEDPTGNPITIEAAIEYNGNSYRVTFGGLDQITIPSGGFVLSDPVGLHIPAGSTIYVRTWLQVANSGDDWPAAYTNSGTLARHGGEGITSGSNVVMNTGALSSSSGFPYGPLCVMGCTDPVKAATIVVGDSISRGTGDIYVNGTHGYIMRALGWDYPVMNYSSGGRRAAETSQDRYSEDFLRLLQGCDYMICTLGPNDFTPTSPVPNLSDVQGYLQNMWDRAHKMGLRVYQATIPPDCTSSDLFQTVGNQTKHANDSLRVQLNDWIRGLPSPLRGIIEAANTVEVNASNILTQNGGFWKVGSTLASGTADNTSTTSYLDDSASAWTTDQWVGYVVTITGGTGSGQMRTILSNTATRLTVASSFSPAPDATSTFIISDARTVDGKHPSGRGYIDMAAAVTPSLFVL